MAHNGKKFDDKIMDRYFEMNEKCIYMDSIDLFKNHI
jgi:hypothetical protein